MILNVTPSIQISQRTSDYPFSFSSTGMNVRKSPQNSNKSAISEEGNPQQLLTQLGCSVLHLYALRGENERGADKRFQCHRVIISDNNACR